MTDRAPVGPPSGVGGVLRPTTVGGVLREAAEAAPDRPGLVDGLPDRDARRRWTFAEMYDEAEQLARALLGRFAPGEHVAVWAPNSADWVLLEFGLALAGLTLVTVNPAFRATELRHVLAQSRAAGIVLVPSYRNNPMADSLASVRAGLPALREVFTFAELPAFAATGSPTERLPVVDPASPAQLQYTSGTTGFPKGALLPHVGITNNSRLLSERLEVEPASVWLNQMPLFHTGGCVLCTLGPVQRLATQVLAPWFDPALTLDLLESERVAVTGGVPTMWLAVLDHPSYAGTDLSALRTVSSGGAAVPPSLVRRIEDSLGVRYATMFGQTEAAPGITMTHLDDAVEDKAATVGTALPLTEIVIADPVTGAVLPPDVPGELRVRSPMLMAGYYDSPAATAAALDADGWLRTGDLCAMDERGYVRVVGRVKDQITRGGENIQPAEIEEVLLAHPAVAQVAVVGVPDPLWGEQVAAFVRLARPAGGQPSPDGCAAELAAWVRARLAPYKTPAHWRFVDDLPTNASGKVQKYRLREGWTGDGGG